MFDKRATTRLPISDVLMRRWSGRAYDPDRPVERSDLIKLLEAARWAPSCFGDQPWRYLMWEKRRNEDAWRRAVECLVEGNRTWAARAPVLMASFARDHFEQNGEPNRWSQHDCGAASMSLCVQATELGLMVHQMGGFDAHQLRSAFAIPDPYVPMAMIAIGYQVPENAVPDSLCEKEFAPRSRLPLSECFFDGEWGVPFSLDHCY